MSILWVLSSFVRWIRLKIYQYEVTFAIYMLTPTEKFIFSTSPVPDTRDQHFLKPRDFAHSIHTTNALRFTDSLLLTLITMIATALYVYLPDHLRTIYGHLWYYWAGERTFMSSRLTSMSSVFGEATQPLEVVYDTAKNTAAATTQHLGEL